VVESLLPKQAVVGSNPITRSEMPIGPSRRAFSYFERHQFSLREDATPQLDDLTGKLPRSLFPSPNRANNNSFAITSKESLRWTSRNGFIDDVKRILTDDQAPSDTGFDRLVERMQAPVRDPEVLTTH
jgi:hypothetical protein